MRSANRNLAVSTVLAAVIAASPARGEASSREAQEQSKDGAHAELLEQWKDVVRDYPDVARAYAVQQALIEHLLGSLRFTERREVDAACKLYDAGELFIVGGGQAHFFWRFRCEGPRVGLDCGQVFKRCLAEGGDAAACKYQEAVCLLRQVSPSR